MSRPMRSRIDRYSSIKNRTFARPSQGPRKVFPRSSQGPPKTLPWPSQSYTKGRYVSRELGGVFNGTDPHSSLGAPRSNATKSRLIDQTEAVRPKVNKNNNNNNNAPNKLSQQKQLLGGLLGASWDYVGAILGHLGVILGHLVRNLLTGCTV